MGGTDERTKEGEEERKKKEIVTSGEARIEETLLRPSLFFLLDRVTCSGSVGREMGAGDGDYGIAILAHPLIDAII